MKRLLGHAFAVTTFGALAIIPSACADNDQSIFALHVMAPPQNRQNGACQYTNDPTQAKISEGVLDVAIRQTYDPVLLVGSQMIGRGDTNAGRAESNRVHVNGASVRVTDANGGAIAEFSTVGSAFLETQQNNVPSYAVVGLTLIDQAAAASIGAGVAPGPNGPFKQVIANVKIFGKTLGGVDLESGEFQFPIKVCKGCLLAYRDDPATPERDCNFLGNTAGGANAVLPCQPGQDEGTPCEYCAADRPVPTPPDFCNSPPWLPPLSP